MNFIYIFGNCCFRMFGPKRFSSLFWLDSRPGRVTKEFWPSRVFTFLWGKNVENNKVENNDVERRNVENNKVEDITYKTIAPKLVPKS